MGGNAACPCERRFHTVDTTVKMVLLAQSDSPRLMWQTVLFTVVGAVLLFGCALVLVLIVTVFIRSLIFLWWAKHGRGF